MNGRMKLSIFVTTLALAFAGPAAAVSVSEAISKSLQTLDEVSLPDRQEERLRCTLAMMRDNSSADDRYFNGFDFNVKQVVDRMNDDLFNALANRVRSDLGRDVAFGAGADIKESLDLLDQRILKGISYLNEHRAVQGVAANPGKIQMNDWISKQQSNQSSVYWCYGDGQS